MILHNFKSTLCDAFYMSCSRTVFVFRFSHSHSASDSKKSNSYQFLASMFLLLYLMPSKVVFTFRGLLLLFYIRKLHGFLGLLWHICFHGWMPLIVIQAVIVSWVLHLMMFIEHSPGAGDILVIPCAKTNWVLTVTCAVGDSNTKTLGLTELK